MYYIISMVTMCYFQLKNMQQMLAMMQAEMQQKAATSNPSKTSAELGPPPASKPPPPPVAARKPSFEGEFKQVATDLENLEKSEFDNDPGKIMESGKMSWKMCFACGVLPRLQWSQNKHSLTG